MTLKETILELTEGGLKIFEYYLDDDINLSKPFKLRDERTPSAHLKCLEGIYILKDFGGSEQAKNGIDFVMSENNIPFVLAMHKIVKDLGLQLDISQYSIKEEFTGIEVDLQPLTDKQIKYFEGRSISKETLNLRRVSFIKTWMPQTESEIDCIAYPYFDNNNSIVNVKYRGFYKDSEGTIQRAFKTHKGGKLSWYGLEDFNKQTTKDVIILEGENDKLSIDELYLANDQLPQCCLSVPNGANSLNAISQESQELFKNVDTFYLFVDNDEAGKKLESDLLRILGKHRCKIIPKKGGKDANEILQNRGFEGLIDCIDNSYYLPVEGELVVKDYTSELYSMFLNGIQGGEKIGFSKFDELISFKTKELTIVSGIPGAGKSTFLNQVLVLLSQLHEWNVCFYSPEFGDIKRHFRELIEQFSGKAFKRPRKNIPENYLLSDDGFWLSYKWLEQYMYFINPPEPTIENMFAAFEGQIRKHNIKAIVIDPFNRIKFKNEKNLNNINDFLTELNAFKKKHDIHIFLVAHPRKMGKRSDGSYEIPTLYDISGSSDFYNQTDNGVVVYRDYKTNLVDVYIQKIKDKDNGNIGFSTFSFNTYNNQYAEVEIQNDKDFIKEPNF